MQFLATKITYIVCIVGHYGDVAITLPNPFLGIYNYTFTSDGINYKCSGTSSMDGCTNTTLVKLNTSLCNEELLDAGRKYNKHYLGLKFFFGCIARTGFNSMINSNFF